MWVYVRLRPIARDISRRRQLGIPSNGRLCDVEYGIGSELWSWPKKLLLRIRVIRQWQGLLRHDDNHHNDYDDTSYDPEMSRWHRRCDKQVRSHGYNYWAFDDKAVCNDTAMGGTLRSTASKTPRWTSVAATEWTGKIITGRAWATHSCVLIDDLLGRILPQGHRGSRRASGDLLHLRLLPRRLLRTGGEDHDGGRFAP